MQRTISDVILSENRESVKVTVLRHRIDMCLDHHEFQGCADVTRSNAPLAVKTCVVTNLTFSHHQCDGIERSYDVIVSGWRVGAVIVERTEAA